MFVGGDEPGTGAQRNDDRPSVARLLYVDAASLSAAGLAAHLPELYRLKACVDAAIVDSVGVFDGRKQYSDDGAFSTSGWIAARADITRAGASATVKVARQARHMPAAMDAAHVGSLGFEKLRVLAAARSVSETTTAAFDDEERLVDEVVARDVETGARLMRGWVAAVDADADDATYDDREKQRKVNLSTSLDGMGFLDGLLTTEANAVLRGQLEAITDDLHRNGLSRDADGNRLTAAQLRHDALVEMARRAGASSTTVDVRRDAQERAERAAAERTAARLLAEEPATSASGAGESHEPEADDLFTGQEGTGAGEDATAANAAADAANAAGNAPTDDASAPAADAAQTGGAHHGCAAGDTTTEDDSAPAGEAGADSGCAAGGAADDDAAVVSTAAGPDGAGDAGAGADIATGTADILADADAADTAMDTVTGGAPHADGAAIRRSAAISEPGDATPIDDEPVAGCSLDAKVTAADALLTAPDKPPPDEPPPDDDLGDNTGGDGGTGPPIDKVAGGLGHPLFAVLVDLDTLEDRAPPDPLQRTCEIVGVGPVATRTVQRLLCDAGVSRLVTRGRSLPLDVGAVSRTATPAQWRALIAHAQGCEFPGCTAPWEWSQAHHLTHWSDQHRTALDILALVCNGHHHLLHHPGWSMSRRDDLTIVVTRPDGAELLAPTTVARPRPAA